MDEDRSACDSYDEIDRYRAAVREEDGDDDDDDMPQDEAEWARGRDAPGGYPVSAAASTLGLDLAEEGDGETVGTTVAGAPEEEARGGGAWNLLEKAACFAAGRDDPGDGDPGLPGHRHRRRRPLRRDGRRRRRQPGVVPPERRGQL